MNNQITNIDLLNKFFDLLSLEPNIKNWSEKYFEDNEPRLYRYLQLIAIFKAYGLTTDFDKFINGTFLKDKNLILSFNLLMEYRIGFIRSLSFTKSIYPSSEPYINIINKINSINYHIKKELEKIDEMILDIIFDDSKTFHLNELVTKYGYPDVDLVKIDIGNI